ncbi:MULTISPECIES: thioesterase domain-containing protein [Micromonospora]|uniref:Thioesterase domain-containing protein n=1 Tax=Micromonospora yangpuensis TaxID=683228 RepID=A0A1C6UQ33_9ACTN|nr:alpha/beta fold hydrolase [Micromonospora yangpuensis]GGM08095.1 hypothetical protein GCM10012279_27730 [Micromonospora yangpuensis]SCL56060.1 Thioesterase domain-containing protein [Micromonospora yangpuensis]
MTTSLDLDRIVPLATGGSGTPLFCVHPGSGSAYPYQPLAGILGDDRPVYGIEAPGFDDDREPVTSLPALCAEYADTLRAFRPAGDFLLLGWSLGGVIALDLAKRLTAAGARVPRVVLVDVSVPHLAALPDEREIAERFLHDLLAAGGTPPPSLDGVLTGLPADADAAAVFTAAVRAGVVPPDLDEELLTGRYAVFHAHVEASYGYQVTGAYHGPVVHLVAADSDGPHLRWAPTVTDLTEHLVPGTHHSIWAGDGLRRLAGLVRSALAGT